MNEMGLFDGIMWLAMWVSVAICFVIYAGMLASFGLSFLGWLAACARSIKRAIWR